MLASDGLLGWHGVLRLYHSIKRADGSRALVHSDFLFDLLNSQILAPPASAETLVYYHEPLYKYFGAPF